MTNTRSAVNSGSSISENISQSQYSDLFASLLLLSIHGFGVSRYWQLLEVISRPSAVFEFPEAALEKLFSEKHLLEVKRLRNEPKHPVVHSTEASLAWCELNDVQIIHHLDEEYPALLKQAHRSPPYLFVKGNVQALAETQIAIVGSRNATRLGAEQSKWVAKSLADEGFAITSGLALGIDSYAHMGALAAGGTTIAVVGTGIDQTYPYRNRYLAEQIVAEGGAIVSEFPLGTVATPQNFPRRNRIISGLSLGTLVVEAAVKSGSLITAKYALEQNREVFALPGSTQNKLSRGCHQLIKQGAILVENAQDIIASLEGFTSRPLEPLEDLPQSEITADESSGQPASTQATSMSKGPVDQSLSVEEAKVFDLVGFDPVSIDSLALLSGLSAGDLMAALMSLELSGCIENDAGMYTRAFDVENVAD